MCSGTAVSNNARKYSQLVSREQCHLVKIVIQYNKCFFSTWQVLNLHSQLQRSLSVSVMDSIVWERIKRHDSTQCWKPQTNFDGNFNWTSSCTIIFNSNYIVTQERMQEIEVNKIIITIVIIDQERRPEIYKIWISYNRNRAHM